MGNISKWIGWGLTWGSSHEERGQGITPSIGRGERKRSLKNQFLSVQGEKREKEFIKDLRELLENLLVMSEVRGAFCSSPHLYKGLETSWSARSCPSTHLICLPSLRGPRSMLPVIQNWKRYFLYFVQLLVTFSKGEVQWLLHYVQKFKILHFLWIEFVFILLKIIMSYEKWKRVYFPCIPFPNSHFCCN